MTVVVALVATTVGGTANAGPSGGALPPVLVEALQVGGEHGVPEDAAMVAATITAIEPFANGWIKAFPCDADEPDTANLNYAADRIANNLVLARLSADGRLCIATRAVTDYVVDVAGYVPAGSGVTPLPSPIRALDTRDGTGGANPSPVPDGRTVELQLADRHGIAKTATLAVFNLTAVGGPVGGRVTAHPCDERPGTTSSVNFPAGRNVANLVVSRLSADGSVCFVTKHASDIVVDVAGFAIDGIMALPTPRRILDTRELGDGLAAESSVTVDPDLPAAATAAFYNLTAVDAPARGFATGHPCDERRPTSSNLNFDGPQAVGAGSVTKLDGDGTFCLFNRSEVHLIVDLIGYTTDLAAYVPMSPIRIKDTREGWTSTCDWAVYNGSSEGPVVVMHSGSGHRNVVPGTSGRRIAVDAAMIDPTCTHAYFTTRPDDHTAPLDLHRVPVRGGDATHIGEVTRRIAGLGVRSDGTIITVEHEGLVSDLAGNVLFNISPHTDSELFVYRADVADDADLLVTLSGESNERDAIHGLHGPPTVEVRDLESGAVMSRFRPPDLTRGVQISADGRYVLLDVSADSVDLDPPQRLEVRTVFGDAVDSVAYFGADGHRLLGWFAGNGELHVCAAEFGTYRWDLFGPIERTLDVVESINPLQGRCLAWQ